jgi:hypothetical protein
MRPTIEELLEALAYLAEQVENDCPQGYRSKHLYEALNDAWELVNNRGEQQ